MCRRLKDHVALPKATVLSPRRIPKDHGRVTELCGRPTRLAE